MLSKKKRLKRLIKRKLKRRGVTITTILPPLSKIEDYYWLIILCVILVIWELAWSVGSIIQAKVVTFPSAHAVIINLITHIIDIKFWLMGAISYVDIVLAILIAFGIAVPLGIFNGLRKLADKSYTPIIMLLGSLPDLALLPILIFIFGYTMVSAIFMGMICAFFPIYFSTRKEVLAISHELFEVTKVFGANSYQTITKLILPAAWPGILNGVRIAFQYLWEILLAIEVLAQVHGIAHFINLSVEVYGSPLDALSGIFFVGILVIITDRLFFARLEARIERWRGEPLE